MRRTHLRGHGNILKRLLVHVSGFNLGLLMWTLVGVGTPRGLPGRLAAVMATLWALVDPATRYSASRPVPCSVREAMRANFTALTGAGFGLLQ